MSDRGGAGLRIGVVGAGSMAARHLRAYRRVHGARVVALCSRRPEPARALCTRFGVARHCVTLDELLGDAVDAVDVVTPTFTHAEILERCFAAGRDALCEKPIARTLDEADRILAAQQRAGRLLMIGFQLRFASECTTAKAWVDAGRVGDVRAAWYRRGRDVPEQAWYRDRALGGGVTAELAVHGIDWLRWTVGSEIASVSAVGTIDGGADDNVWAVYRFRNGAIGAVGASYGFNFIERDMGIVGSTAAVKFRRGRAILDAHGGGRHVLRTAGRDWAAGLRVPVALLRDTALVNELQEFVDCVRDRRQPRVTGEEARKALEAVLATLRAMETGAPVTLH